MSWGVRLKEVIDDSSVYDSVKLVIQYYNKQIADQHFEEIYPFTIDNSWEEIRKIVLGKLEILNIFRRKVEELKSQIGQIIDPAQAIGLGLHADRPVAK